MPDPLPPVPHQRARGALHLALRRRGLPTVLEDLREEGCLRARFPRPRDGDTHETVLLNVSGGVAPGDEATVHVRLGEGARAVVAGQAAERFYRAAPGSRPARLRTVLTLGAGASLCWLPQGSILFDGTALDRETAVHAAADARLLAVEQLVLGRAAMGEVVRRLHLRDLLHVRRDGEPVLHDAVRVHDPAALAGAATAGGACAVATVLLLAPDAERRLDAVRALLAGHAAVEGGASAWDGMLLCRLLAPGAAALRRAVVPLLQVLRDGRTLPGVWGC